MNKKIKQANLDNSFITRIQKFQKLMKFKVRDILLVSSLYDSYIFEEDGRLYDLIRQEYLGLNLNHTPDITHVSSGAEAVELALSDDRYDLIICTLHIQDMHPIEFAKMARKAGIDKPIVLLAFDNKERKEFQAHHDASVFDNVFIWQGDYRLLLGIIKYIEDKYNVDNDVETIGVQVIILIEDNVLFYSSYLPMIYSEILKQSQRLISESVNLSHKFLRMRARPKILLSATYEQAWEYFTKYQKYVLGIISDINFKKYGVRDPKAGLEFAQKVKQIQDDIPILLQSSNLEHLEDAKKIGVSFLHKNSPRLLHELREFMLNNFGFGDFVFKTPDGIEVGRASDLKTLEEQLRIVPPESIKYHAERNHFSNWLKARTEFWLAHKLRPKRVEDFPTIEDLRKELVNSIEHYRNLTKKGIILDFDKNTFDPNNTFARIGGGSLGGKARGLGFANTLINNYGITDRFPGIKIFIPSAVVIGTDVFDQFMEENQLESYALNEEDDLKILKKFIEAPKFPEETIDKLRDFLTVITEPLAVRSSSLLEDSQYQPFAGVYQTYMIPNSSENLEIRLNELLQTIKSVYASTYFKNAKNYIKITPYRLEEEKMAVVIQRMVGKRRGNIFYPDFAGVAKSYNFYPIPPQKAKDGIALVGYGLGKYVVDGGNAIRFSPKHPKSFAQFYSVKETLRNSQTDFFALNMTKSIDLNKDDTHDCLIDSYKIEKAFNDEYFGYFASTYSPENNAIYDGISREGMKIITFAPILKHNLFPLADILDLLLEVGSWGMGSQIEIEFAANLNVEPGQPKEFALLQMRPLVLSREVEELNVEDIPDENLICKSDLALGHGSLSDIKDIVFVDINKFERGKSRIVADEVSQINSFMLKENRPYILIGLGRWGTLDPWLGIPVNWEQICGAAAIVESGFKDFQVEPSQGSHFFQNITSFNVFYFTVNFGRDNASFIDWNWLLQQKTEIEKNFVKLVSFDRPILIKVNGQKHKGIIIKPE